MKQLVKYFYKNYHVFARVALLLLILDSAIRIVKNITENDVLGIVCNVLIIALYIVPTLIGLGLIQYKGLSGMFIDLSQYSFLSGLDYEDFNLSKDKVAKVKALFETKMKASGDVINPLKLAREIAIEHDLDSLEYMFCLHVAARALQIGKNIDNSIGIDPSNAEALKNKLRELKKKLDNERNKGSDEQSEGKYDFL